MGEGTDGTNRKSGKQISASGEVNKQAECKPNQATSHLEKPRDKFVENVQNNPFSNAFDTFAKSYPERPMNSDVPVQTETHPEKSDVKSGDGVHKVSSSKPSPVKPKDKKELELVKQLQK